MTSHLGAACKPAGALMVGAGVTVRLQRTMENQGPWESSWGSEASTQLISSGLPTDNAYFHKDISNMDNKNHKQSPFCGGQST